MEYPTGECLSCDKLADEITTLRQRVAELEARLERINPLLDEAADKIDALEKKRDELLKAIIHIQQVACSGSPELGIATNALASVEEK